MIDEITIRSSVNYTLETIFVKDKHQDVLHQLMDAEIYDVLIKDIQEGLETPLLVRASDKAKSTYIVERARLYAETYLNLLHERVGTDAMLDEGLVRED